MVLNLKVFSNRKLQKLNWKLGGFESQSFKDKKTTEIELKTWWFLNLEVFSNRKEMKSSGKMVVFESRSLFE